MNRGSIHQPQCDAVLGRGVLLPKAVIIAVVLAVLCAGCSSASMSPSLGSSAALNTGSTGVPLASATAKAGEVPRKTIASKVLAAIALERVTGRTPDPARFADLN